MDISLRDTTEKQPQSHTSAVPEETLAMWETATGSLKASILQADETDVNTGMLFLCMSTWIRSDSSIHDS